mmetsp:Transcript_52749/g.83739  ORF Transcript_52749/g.83739 Transcript_52749/m.83739 type:complete len:83 (+) Transcript_52749:697-945(+)
MGVLPPAAARQWEVRTEPPKIPACLLALVAPLSKQPQPAAPAPGHRCSTSSEAHLSWPVKCLGCGQGAEQRLSLMPAPAARI